MIKRLIAFVAILSVSASVASAAYLLSPDSLKGITPIAIGPEAGGVVTSHDVAGTEFWDLEVDPFSLGVTDPDNIAHSFSISLGGPGTVVTGIGWDVIQSSVGASWGSEMKFGFDQEGDGLVEVQLTTSPTGGVVTNEANSSGGIVKLADVSIPDLVLTDGSLYIWTYESFDDVPNAVDGMINSGSLSFQADVVPEPTAMGLLLLAGLSGLCVLRRR